MSREIEDAIEDNNNSFLTHAVFGITVIDIRNIRLIPRIIEAVKGLRTIKGDQGTKGDKGIQGLSGRTPRKGVDYFTPTQAKEFLRAATPIKGVDYVDGENGAIGQKGMTGDQGQIGETGPVGPEGKSRVGRAGKKGEDGLDGIQGPSGIDGKSITKSEIKKLIPEIDTFILGTKRVNEENIGKDTYLQFNGAELVYAELPKLVEQIRGFTSRTGISSITQLNVSVETITSSDTLDLNNYVILCDCTNNPITVTLPPASEGKIYHIKKIDNTANKVTLDADGSETIDGDLNPEITAQYESFHIISDGSNFHVI